MKYFMIILFLIISWCNGCINVSLEPDKAAPRLAVVGLISPTDSIMSVFVSRVYNIGEEISLDTGLVVKNAIVKISNGSNSVRLFFKDSTGKYEVTMHKFISYGNMYTLSVEVPGEDLVTGTCKVVNEIDAIRLDTSSDNKDFHVKVSWKDDPSEENYYSLSGHYRSVADTITTYGMLWNASKYYSIDIDAPDILEGSQMIIDGTIAQGRVKTPVFVSLVNVDKNAFNYFDKRTKQYYQQQSLQQSIVDFVFHASSNGGKLSDVFERFKDPIILPNTIKNGIGVFGSYSSHKWIIPVHK